MSRILATCSASRSQQAVRWAMESPYPAPYREGGLYRELRYPPPDVARGGYFEQVIGKVPFYVLPPSVHNERVLIHRGFSRGTVFGPVHAVDRTFRFVSVLVPRVASWTLFAPIAFPHHVGEGVPDLVWINVWTPENQLQECVGVDFCRKVPEKKVAGWRRAGWEDCYYDGSR